MFGLNMYSCAARSINNHAEAVAFYESCKTKRGHDHAASGVRRAVSR